MQHGVSQLILYLLYLDPVDIYLLYLDPVDIDNLKNVKKKKTCYLFRHRILKFCENICTSIEEMIGDQALLPIKRLDVYLNSYFKTLQKYLYQGTATGTTIILIHKLLHSFYLRISSLFLLLFLTTLILLYIFYTKS
mgnify:CR=1 FL=1